MDELLMLIADAVLELRDYVNNFDPDDLCASDIIESDEYRRLMELADDYEARI